MLKKNNKMQVANFVSAGTPCGAADRQGGGF